MKFYHAVLTDVSMFGRTQYNLKLIDLDVSHEVFGSEHEAIIYLQKLGYGLVAVDNGKMYFKKAVE